MTQHGRGQLLDIFRQHKIPSGKPGPGAGGAGKPYAGPGAGAHRNEGFELGAEAAAGAGGTDKLHQIVLEPALHLHRLHRAAGREQGGLAQG
ncbi:hypothetical protein D3C77_194790 [compost metagenome]